MTSTNDISAVITIESLVSDVVRNDDSEDLFIDLLKLAIRGVKKLNIFHLDIPKVYIGEISSINYMELPDDFVDMSYIGYISDGGVQLIARNKRIKYTILETDGVETAFDENTSELEIPVVKHYSLPAGFSILSVHVNERYNRLEFKGDGQGTPIYLEYTSTGVGINTYIPAIAQETLIRWIEWNMEEKKEGATLYDRRWKKNLYDEELKKMMTYRKRLPPPEEFIRQINTVRKQTIKG